jgi:uncharacterized membrane protein YoaT (DUF817 family)
MSPKWISDLESEFPAPAVNRNGREVAPVSSAGFLPGWTSASFVLLAGIAAAAGCIVLLRPDIARLYFPVFNWGYGLAWWRFDWLLLSIFALMIFVIMQGADLRRDGAILLVGVLGGLTIEAWGTQTSLWRYQTQERPPLWIIPAWPIAALAIDRMVRLLDRQVAGWRAGAGRSSPLFAAGYWLVMAAFYGLMLSFVWPTRSQSLTVAVLILCAIAIVAPTERRLALLTFTAGSALGLFLELWGTTRACWIYYTGQTPPLFAVLAHGMAALVFWQATVLLRTLAAWLGRLNARPSGPATP